MHPYVAHLSKDKKLKKLIDEQGEISIRSRKNIPLRLCASIMSQQLSVKVAEVIFKRFLNLYGKKEPTPQQIVDTPHETLRSIGLSNSKANYVKNVAQFAIDNGWIRRSCRK
jgi:DNA-3-methyladenine glycosylase II